MKKTIAIFIFFACFIGLLQIPINGKAFFGLWESRHQNIQETNGQVLIPINNINDGQAHYFSYKSQGEKINFFVLKSRDGIIRAAFDACDVCFTKRKGYTQAGDFMICNNCGQRFHSTMINVLKGGCNPAPLRRTIDGKHLIITATDIRTGSYFF